MKPESPDFGKTSNQRNRAHIHLARCLQSLFGPRGLTRPRIIPESSCVSKNEKADTKTVETLPGIIRSQSRFSNTCNRTTSG